MDARRHLFGIRYRTRWTRIPLSKEFIMLIMSTQGGAPHRLNLGKLLGLLLALVIAASGPIAEASPVRGLAPRARGISATSTITELGTSFRAVEGLAFSGVIATFNDSTI